MLKIPEALLEKYDMILVKNDIPPQFHGNYKKWIRYYLDFCNKYQNHYSSSNSLPLFIDKLKEKKQSTSQQDQARPAARLYYSGITTKSPAKSHRGQIGESAESFNTAQDLTPWVAAIKSLSHEIKLRHYSKKTLKSYSLWAKKLKYFTNDKLPEQLTPDDVKNFLTFLAAEKKVSGRPRTRLLTRCSSFSGTS